MFTCRSIAIVDVRDVADAHVIAVEHPEAAGQRLFCANQAVSYKYLANTLAKLYPQYPNTKIETDAVDVGEFTVDTTPLARLGKSDYVPFETMIKDTVESLIRFNLVERK